LRPVSAFACGDEDLRQSQHTTTKAARPVASRSIPAATSWFDVRARELLADAPRGVDDGD
jgi:hypothetical protein